MATRKKNSTVLTPKEDISGGAGFYVGGVSVPKSVSTPPTPGVTPPATMKSLGLTFTPDPNQATIDSSYKSLLDSYGTKAPSEKAVRSSVLQQFQGEIDALDMAAAQARSRITGNYEALRKGNLGTDAAIQARRGLLGSDFGSARTDQVNYDINNRMGTDIATSDSGFNTAKASLYTQARAMANDQYNKKLEAYRTGAAATVDYLRGKSTQAAANAAQLAKQAIMAKIDLTLPEYATDLAALAKSIGTTPDALKMSYQEQKSAAEKAAEEEARKRLLEDRTYNLDVDKYNLDVNKENNLNAREGAKLNFDIDKFNLEYALNKEKTEAEIAKINNDIANGGANGTISPEFAAKYGLPIGAKLSDVAGMIPGQQEKIDAASTELDNRNEILALVNDLKTDLKGQNALGGSLGLNVPRNIQGTAEYAWRAKFDRLKAALALNEAGKLKGSGAVSDAERALLAESASALNINSKSLTLEELNRIEEKARNQANKLNTFLTTTQTSSLINQFEGGASQYGPPSPGGSSGTNPKAQSGPVSLRSVNTQTLASAVVPRYPNGTNLGNKEGQCVTFLHKIADFPPIGDGKNEKIASLNRMISQGKGLPKDQLMGGARVGMILISNDNKTYGHGAMINAISADGKYARLTESNRLKPGTVTHTRVVALNDPSLYGAIIPNNIRNLA